MKTLVTGGAGFLGSHLCELLLSKGHEVLCIDNLQTGTENNITQLQKNKNFKFMNHDITFPINVKVDQIYNLACPASPFDYQKTPVKTIKTNVLGAINMLEISKNTGARILQASTSEVYGDPLTNPQTEDYWGNVNPIGVRSCYDEGKRCAETMFFDYNRQYGLDIKVIRIFNTYGPKMNLFDGRVISNFVVSALQNKPLTVYGSGNQTRSFCFVTDLIDGMYLMMNSAAGITGPINLGNPMEISMNALAEKIILMTKSSSKVLHLDALQDDPRQRCPDIGLASRYLRWKPNTSLTDGLDLTIDYFSKLLGYSI
jgi:UDP-glucuronate decarboxylase